MAQCMNELASAVDACLAQNRQRNNVQEGMSGAICAALTTLATRLETNNQDNIRMAQKSIGIQQRMGEMATK